MLPNKRTIIVIAIIIALTATYSFNSNSAPPTTNEAISQILPNEVTGHIEGSVCYPSDSIPGDMRIYAVNLSTSRIYMTPLTDKEFPNKFWFGVPVGDYYVYAMTNSVKNLEGYKAYYSEFVTCGQTVNCKSHKPIRIQVVAGITTSNIRPCDWYDRANRSK